MNTNRKRVKFVMKTTRNNNVPRGDICECWRAPTIMYNCTRNESVNTYTVGFEKSTLINSFALQDLFPHDLLAPLQLRSNFKQQSNRVSPAVGSKVFTQLCINCVGGQGGKLSRAKRSHVADKRGPWSVCIIRKFGVCGVVRDFFVVYVFIDASK